MPLSTRSVTSNQALAERSQAAVSDLSPALIPTDTDLTVYNQQYLSRHPQSPAHIFGAAKGLSELRKTSETRTTDITAVLDHLCDEGVPPSVPVMLEAIQLLRDLKASAEEIGVFRNKCKARVPLATVFDPETELAARRREAVDGKEVANGVGHADL